MKSITYIFSKHRKENYFNNNVEAKEFYYGLTEFDSKENNLNIIEFEDSKNVFNSLLLLIDKVLRKFFSLPFYTSKICNIKNLKILLKTDHLFLVNESVGCSTLPLLLVIKFYKKINVSLFVMGLYSKNLRFRYLKFFHNLLIKILIFFVDDVLFLGEGEMNKAINFHGKRKKKFIHMPFSIDTKFWNSTQQDEMENRKKIIFVGNDGNRDYELLIQIAKKLRKYNFIFVSSNDKVQKLKFPNVEIVKGYWGSKDVTDTKLKEIYNGCRLSIIPLKESYQPSGQSVALQSMALGLPVIISSTKGFWASENFIDKENIFFVYENTIDTWVNKIIEIYEDPSMLGRVGKAGKEIVNKKYDLISFYNKLLTLIGK
tara:strand:+ start:1337 stop:2452 length:1116 start_codon:yes stop_codon:yes gene_type:complete